MLWFSEQRYVVQESGQILDTLDQESKMSLLSNGAEQLRGDIAADPRL